MNFSEALEKVKNGAKAAREGWNGKEQYIELAKCISYVNSEGKIIKETLNKAPYTEQKTK